MRRNTTVVYEGVRGYGLFCWPELGMRLNKCARDAQGSDAVVCLRTAGGLDAGSLACVRGLEGSGYDVAVMPENPKACDGTR